MIKHFFALLIALFVTLPAAAGEIFITAEEDGRAGLLYKGSIVDGDGEKVERALADLAKDQDVIPFTFVAPMRFGVDQWVEPAMKIGEALRKFPTCVTAKVCTGLCVLAFIGGQQRSVPVQEDGILGPDFWFSRDAAAEEHARKPSAKTAFLMGWLKRYLTGMTGDDGFYNAFTTAPGYGKTTLTLEQARQLGVITAEGISGSAACGKPIS
jgi:hypothetical protein